MISHFKIAAAEIATDPSRLVPCIPILPEEERERVLVQWNGPVVEYPHAQSVHHLFEAQVEHEPGKTAIVCSGKQLSYGELNERANQLAHYLGRLGVGSETLVGICVDRSIEMIVGLLGILKAGGAYVPLDPEYPTERLAFMMQNAQAPILLTQEHLRANLPKHTAEVVYLDSSWDLISQES